MKRLSWEIRHVWQAIGRPGWLGLALLFACALGWWLVVIPLRHDTRTLTESFASSERRLALRSTDNAPARSTPQEQLVVFQRRFPSDKGIANSLARLQAAATEQGIRLDHAEFRLIGDAGQALQRYTIATPVKADYKALRQFSRDALLQLPGLAIEEISLRRNDPKSAVIDAQLRFVLFVTKSN